jgi:hypothetical protein
MHMTIKLFQKHKTITRMQEEAEEQRKHQVQFSQNHNNAILASPNPSHHKMHGITNPRLSKHPQTCDSPKLWGLIAALIAYVFGPIAHSGDPGENTPFFSSFLGSEMISTGFKQFTRLRSMLYGIFS